MVFILAFFKVVYVLNFDRKSLYFRTVNSFTLAVNPFTLDFLFVGREGVSEGTKVYKGSRSDPIKKHHRPSGLWITAVKTAVECPSRGI